MKELELQLGDYAQELNDFRHQTGLKVFNRMPDYLALKAADEDDFNKLIEKFRPMSHEITAVRRDDRLVATAELLGTIALPPFGPIDWVRISEPKPKSKGQDRIGLDHVGFYRVDYDKTKDELTEKEIPFTKRKHDFGSYIEVGFGNDREVKLTSRATQNIVWDEMAMRKATRI
ncbi:MAG TPA: hypothetical protein VLF39_03880 [Candidatus Saccharimonadales bacterium]|nr:hypothetical protein [Candidatus Saccharimonadales bacterium]